MPPRKNVDNSSPTINQVKKVPKMRIRKEKPLKPKLKTPSILRIKLPPINKLSSSPGPNALPKKKMSVAEKNLEKVDLANEVAFAQLSNQKVEPEIKEEPPETIKPQPKPKPVKRRQLKRKAPPAEQLLAIPEVAIVDCAKASSPGPNALPKKKMSVAEKNLEKVDLANEVAFAQLSNQKVEPEIKEEPPETIKPQPKPKPVKRRQLKRKAPPAEQLLAIPEVAIVDCAKDVEEKPAPKRKRGRPKCAVPDVTSPKLVINEDLNITNDTELEVKPAPKRKRGRATPAKTEVKIETTPQPVPIENTDTTVKKIKADSTSKTKTPKPKPRPGTSRPRRNTGKMETQSPSILDAPANQQDSAQDVDTFKPDIMVNLTPSVPSRKNSETSLSECPSWTKNISSSSTTTCMTVDSSDFFKKHTKLPIVKLHKLKNKPTAVCDKKVDEFIPTTPERSSSSSDSDSSSDTSSNSSNSLNLSTSSISSPVRPFQNHSQTVEYKKVTWYTDKLVNELKNIDLEVINWLGSTNDNKDLTKISQEVLNELKHERDILMYCQKLKEIFSDEINGDADTEVLQNIESPQIADNDPNLNQTRCDDSPMGITKDRSPQKSVKNFDYLNDNANFAAPVNREPDRTDIIDDDDDALSLFAESLTGFDSTRLNSSMDINPPPEIDEYIPQPVSITVPAQKITYNPTKITEDSENNNQKSKTICEKQNADSTSIPRDADQLIKLATEMESISIQNTSMPPPLINPISSCLISAKYRPINAVRSQVFKGVCFFNLISNCKKTRCLFPHKKIPIHEVKNKIAILSEVVFIREYMLTRNFPILRRLYMMFFVQECLNRHMTRLLMEMALDSVLKENVNAPEDAILKVECIETALTHLNEGDLKICEDILLYKIGAKLLCDVFIDSIAETQNFSRFKQIFVKLVHFIVENKRTFCLEATKHILERVCILPFELRVSEALVMMLKNTAVKIFEDSKIEYFEMVLAKFDVMLYEELIGYKQNVRENPPEINNSFAPVNVNPEVELRPIQSERERYTSPDTTKLDSNKTLDETIPNTQNIGNNVVGTNSSTSNDSDEYFTPNSKFRSWRTPFVKDNRNLSVTRLKRPADRLVAYGSPVKFPRPLDPPQDMF